MEDEQSGIFLQTNIACVRDCKRAHLSNFGS